MSETDKHAGIDPERPREGRRADRATGYSGQEYDRDEPLDPPAATREPAPETVPGQPPEAGKRPSIDRPSGEVHGSGSGTGGGAAGEDYDVGPPAAAPIVPQREERNPDPN